MTYYNNPFSGNSFGGGTKSTSTNNMFDLPSLREDNPADSDDPVSAGAPASTTKRPPLPVPPIPPVEYPSFGGSTTTGGTTTGGTVIGSTTPSLIPAGGRPARTPGGALDTVDAEAKKGAEIAAGYGINGLGSSLDAIDAQTANIVKGDLERIQLAQELDAVSRSIEKKILIASYQEKFTNLFIQIVDARSANIWARLKQLGAGFKY